MKKCKTLYLLMAAGLLAACSAEQETAGTDGTTPISLGYQVVTVDDVTRAATADQNDDYLDAGEKVKVIVVEGGGYDPYNYTTGAAGVLTSDDPPTYPTNGSTVDILAFYPASVYNADNNEVSFSVSSDQRAVGDPDGADDASRGYKGSDLMWATPVMNQSRTYSKVNLQLHHLMAKVNVNATIGAGSGITAINSVTLKNVKRTVTFNQTTGAIGAATSAAAPNDGEEVLMLNEGSALIPPQAISGEFIDISVTTASGTETVTYTLTSKAFLTGHEYTLNIEVNSAAIGNTNAITGWTSEGTVNVQTILVMPVKLANVTDDHIGWIVTQDGFAYPPHTKNLISNKVAMVAYAGTASNCSHGLAIGLTDVNSTTYIYSQVSSAVSAWGSSNAVSGGSWRLPTLYDWEYMVIGSGSPYTYVAESDMANNTYWNATNFHNNLSELDGSMSGQYWSSTSYHHGGGWLWTYIYQPTQCVFSGRAGDSEKYHPVRAVLAF